jgi:N-acetyl-gamma-glutamyl-phosphate reductase
VGTRIGIVGASGYGGAELLRLAQAHPHLEVAVVAAHSQAGEPVSSLFPNLQGARTFDRVEVDALVDLDAVVLATPHGPALDLGATLADAGTRVVDLSAAFRLDAEGFATWYGEPHPRPDLTPAVYGLTEHTRDAVAGATLVANPGCYPTATLLGLLPLVDLVDPATVVVDAKSGTSGAGRGATDTLHASHVHGNLTPYGAPAHRHTGEVEAGLVRLGGASPAPVSFTPHLLPVARGLLATCYATLVDGAGADDVAAALHDAYDTEPFVHVLPAGTFPGIKQVVGSNACHLSAVVDPRTRRVVVTSVIDNLGKGAAGQALQNLNLLLCLDETAGLSAIGVYP